MNPRTLLLTAAAVSLGLVVPAASAALTLSSPVSMGDKLYAVTSSATNAFNRNLDQMRTDALAAAKKFCESQGNVMKLVSVVVDKPHFSLGYYSVKVIFKSLKPDDPELTAPPPGPAPAAGIPAAGSGAPTGTGDYYNDLLKLDDLHKRGIITDKEFEREKKKLLKDWK